MEEQMLIAEALAARKDKKSEIADLQQRIQSSLFKYEDEDDKEQEDPEKLVAQLRAALDEVQQLNVRINDTNNETRFKFDKGDYSIMEAIAFRERLMAEQRAIRSIYDAGSASRYNPFATRSKDDIKQVLRMKVKPLRKQADDLAEKVRRLDIEIQKVNWSTDLL